MNQSITIAQLAPNLRGSFTLRFEVVSAQPSSNNPDEIFLHIADESGCINAYFNNHGKHIKPGNVYELTNLKCKVVDHSLRLELAKDSKISRIKFDMAFKDLVNNLSEKFYVSKTEQVAVSGQKSQANQELASKQQGQKSQSGNSQQGPSPGKQNGKAKESKSEPQVQHTSIVGKDARNSKVEEKELNHALENGKRDNSATKGKYNLKQKPSKNLIPKEQQLKQDQKLAPQEKAPKIKYVEKRAPPPSYSEQRQKQKEANPIKHSNQRTLLKDMYLYQEREVNLFVQIETMIKKDKYTLVKGCDCSGAAYIQFDSRCHLESKVWYCLKKFTVYRDKNYGFLACQQAYSTYDILEQYDEVPDHRPIYFPKSK